MRAVILVIDSFGIGALPDAEQYGDRGANTALHICESVDSVEWPNLKAFGLGNAAQLLGFDLPGCEAVKNPKGFYSVMAEKSPGKDTTTGHWELAGIVLDKPFQYFSAEYPSFPKDLVSAFEKETARKVIGNRAASGTVIIEELGREHMETGALICYTSADSVFQIAAHEEVVPLEELYRYCRIARERCNPLSVGRVIARPFSGEPGSFKRTAGRKDFSLPLPKNSILDHLSQRGVETVGVGKIGDIFNEQGLDRSYHDKGNKACLDRTAEVLREKNKEDQLVFVNLVDTDMHFGHRRDPQGYHDAVREVDTRLPEMMDSLDNGDLLMITADHGCDPIHSGTDHTREYVPLLIVKKGEAGQNCGIRSTFADLAQTLAFFFKKEPYEQGTLLF